MLEKRCKIVKRITYSDGYFSNECKCYYRMNGTASEIELLFRRIAMEDDSALWKLHELYFSRLFRFIYALTGVKETAEELVNDVFLTLWQKKHLLNEVEKPELYLFVIARNKTIKQLRKRKIFMEPLNALHDFECVIQNTPYNILITTELRNRINEAIHSLPPRCKLIFSLVKENNLKYREVAELLDLSVKTVENQMGIALKKLSQSISLSFSS